MNEEILRLKELAESEQYLAIKSKLLDYIIKLSNSTIEAEKLKGMLMLLNSVEGWKENYLAELNKIKRYNERKN